MAEAWEPFFTYHVEHIIVRSFSQGVLPHRAMLITWKHTKTTFPWPWTTEQKVEILYHRIWGWQLHVAELMMNGGKSHEETKVVEAIPHQGFAALQICLSYFETIAKYEAGDVSTKDSKESFIKGFMSVFPEVASFPYLATREALGFLYAGARCGLYHASMTAPGVGLDTFDGVMAFRTSPKQLVINPHRLPGALTQHLRAYIQKLKDPANADLRKSFERRFAADFGFK